MNHPEKSDLLHDLFQGDAALREKSLKAGLRAVHRTRNRRRGSRIALAGVAALLLAILVWVPESSQHDVRLQSMVPLGKRTVEGTPIVLISDQELLDLFSDQPVALVTKSGGQELLFLDEKN